MQRLEACERVWEKQVAVIISTELYVRANSFAEIL